MNSDISPANAIVLEKPPGAGPMDELEDCLRRVAEERDVGAFETLFLRLAPLAKGYMIHGGTDAATAEELAQEAMVRVWRKAPSYSREKGNVKAWFFAIVRNLRIDRVRRERVWRLSEELKECHSELAAPGRAVDERLHGTRRDATVRNALAALPEDQGQVIRMSFLEGLSHSEIADRLSIPLGTVKSRIRLAYEHLRPGLTGQL